MNHRYPTALLLFLVLFFSNRAIAQDDMMAMLRQQSDSSAETVIATFKSPKLINLQSPETVKKRNLEFRITHLFGNIGLQSGGGVHTLYGFDQSNDIRIGFTYGLTDRLNIGISRFKRFENLMGEIKFRALEQTSDGSMPFSLTLWTNGAYSPRIYSEFTKSVYRLTYATQAILARKLSSSLSLELVPSWVHQNLVDPIYENDLYSLGAGGRVKFTRSASIVVDYMYTFNRPETDTIHFDPLGVGLEIETGGHVFTIMLTNASGILENDYVPHTVDSWEKGGMKFSFHITRMFTFQKKPKNGNAQ